jgi:hypothetical protein
VAQALEGWRKYSSSPSLSNPSHQKLDQNKIQEYVQNRQISDVELWEALSERAWFNSNQLGTEDNQSMQKIQWLY